jgi:hypothetical protein
MAETRNEEKELKLKIEEDEPLGLWLIPEIYGWLIILIGICLILILVPTAIGNFYFEGFSIETVFNSVLLLIEGFGIGLGFIGFGAALRRLIIVQATLGVIFLLITIWFLYFFSIYGEWGYCLKSLLIGIGVTFPLALCIFVNRKRLSSE